MSMGRENQTREQRLIRVWTSDPSQVEFHVRSSPGVPLAWRWRVSPITFIHSIVPSERTWDVDVSNTNREDKEDSVSNPPHITWFETSGERERCNWQSTRAGSNLMFNNVSLLISIVYSVWCASGDGGSCRCDPLKFAWTTCFGGVAWSHSTLRYFSGPWLITQSELKAKWMTIPRMKNYIIQTDYLYTTVHALSLWYTWGMMSQWCQSLEERKSSYITPFSGLRLQKNYSTGENSKKKESYLLYICWSFLHSSDWKRGEGIGRGICRQMGQVHGASSIENYGFYFWYSIPDYDSRPSLESRLIMLFILLMFTHMTVL